MAKGRPEKYNRITQQQKFMLRRLITKENLSIKQAAQTLRINYSTAKTIMFFHRKSSSDILTVSAVPFPSRAMTATYHQLSGESKMQIISTVGGDAGTMKNDGEVLEETHEQNEYKI